MAAMRHDSTANDSRPATPSLVRQALMLRGTFQNWIVVGAVSLLVLPGRFPPRRGWARGGRIRLRLRTRNGQVLETEAGNSWPVIEVFHGEYERRIAWEEMRQVLDVGAHVGAFTCWAASRAPRARITAFEPEPRNFADLQTNVLRNNLGGRVALVNAAAASVDREAGLRVHDGDRQLSSLVAPAGESVPVRCINLDRYIGSCCEGPIDLLKMDVEGAEWDALSSLRDETWSRISRVVVEVHTFGGHRLRDMEDLLQSRGYETHLSGEERGGYFDEAFILWGERTA
jgi:FkbM family methyltransferase